MADGDDFIRATRSVVDLVIERVAAWEFIDEQAALNQAMGAAGLLRVAELLDEADALNRRGRTVGANVLVRTAFEFWLTGTYALFGGIDAVVGIEAARLRYEQVVASKNGLPEGVHTYLQQQEEVLAEAKAELLAGAKPSSTKLEQIATRLGPLIFQATGETTNVLALYDLMYRAHSTYDAHPPKSIGAMVDWDEGEANVVRVRPIAVWNDTIGSSATMAAFAAVLGRWIEEQVDGDIAPWIDVFEQLSPLLAKSDNGEILDASAGDSAG